jgi:hypothetical protein
MISAQPNKPQQEKLISKLMELPNNAVSFLLLYCASRLNHLHPVVGLPYGPSRTQHGRVEQS